MPARRRFAEGAYVQEKAVVGNNGHGGADIDQPVRWAGRRLHRRCGRAPRREPGRRRRTGNRDHAAHGHAEPRGRRHQRQPAPDLPGRRRGQRQDQVRGDRRRPHRRHRRPAEGDHRQPRQNALPPGRHVPGDQAAGGPRQVRQLAGRAAAGRRAALRHHHPARRPRVRVRQPVEPQAAAAGGRQRRAGRPARPGQRVRQPPRQPHRRHRRQPGRGRRRLDRQQRRGRTPAHDHRTGFRRALPSPAARPDRR